MPSQLKQLFVQFMTQRKSADVVAAVNEPEIRTGNPSRFELGTVGKIAQVLDKTSKVSGYLFQRGLQVPALRLKFLQGFEITGLIAFCGFGKKGHRSLTFRRNCCLGSFALQAYALLQKKASLWHHSMFFRSGEARA